MLSTENELAIIFPPKVTWVWTGDVAELCPLLEVAVSIAAGAILNRNSEERNFVDLFYGWKIRQRSLVVHTYLRPYIRTYLLYSSNFGSRRTRPASTGRNVRLGSTRGSYKCIIFLKFPRVSLHPYPKARAKMRLYLPIWVDLTYEKRPVASLPCVCSLL